MKAEKEILYARHLRSRAAIRLRVSCLVREHIESMETVEREIVAAGYDVPQWTCTEIDNGLHALRIELGIFHVNN